MASSFILGACESEAPAEPGSPVVVPAPADIATENVTLSEPGKTTIVFLGDSLTAGFGLSTTDALPEQLEALFHAEGREDLVFINAGVSGDTTGGGLARYDWSVASADPDLLIVALGANDFFGGVDPANVKANLAAIIERAQADDLPIILASVEAGEIAEIDEFVAAYTGIYPELAEAYNVPLYTDVLSGVRGNANLVQQDGLHPTKEGVAVMAERMSEFLWAHLPED